MFVFAAGHDAVDLVDQCFAERRAPVPRPRQVDGELGADPSRVGRQDEDAVGEQDGFFDVVGDDEHRACGEVVARPEGEELGAEVLGGEDVERGERFVHEQRVGFDDERACEADALAHAAGELFGVGGFETVEADEVDGAFGAVAALGGRDVAGFETELDVLADGEPRQQREGLEHHRDAGVRGDDGCVLVDGATTCRRDETGEATQQGGLAGAGLAEEGDDLAVVELEVDVVEHRERRAVGRCEGLADVVGGEDRRPLGRRVGHSEYLVSASRYSRRHRRRFSPTT